MHAVIGALDRDLQSVCEPSCSLVSGDNNNDVQNLSAHISPCENNEVQLQASQSQASQSMASNVHESQLLLTGTPSQPDTIIHDYANQSSSDTDIVFSAIEQRVY